MNGQEIDNALSDIAHRHTPDSVRQEQYQELMEQGYTKAEIQQMADEKYGDFWG